MPRGQRNIVSHRNEAEGYTTEVWTTETGALNEGVAVCYDHDVGTAANFDDDRGVTTSLPSQSNNHAFAGVTTKSYTANAAGQRIKIFVPGSICRVRVKEATTIGDVSYLFMVVGGSDAGEFTTNQGFVGQGAAKCLQTQATVNGLCQAELVEGGVQSGGVEFITPAAGGGATAMMVGGKTVFDTAVTLGADATATLADGTYAGQWKMYSCEAAMTTNNIVITVTSGEQLDGATDLATLTLDAADEVSVLQYSGHAVPGWRLMHNAGTALA